MTVELQKQNTLLLEQIKQAVKTVEPNAEIVLFGSRARGDALGDSDWDFLILLDGIINEERQSAVRQQLFKIELESGEVLCSLIRSHTEWEHPLFKSMPFYQNVRREGFRL